MKTNRLTLIRGWAAALLLAVALLLPQAAAAYDFMVGGLCYNKNSDGTSVTVTYENSNSFNNPYYSDLSGDLVIPVTVTYSGTTYSVTSIGSYAFNGCSGLTSVTIPNSVTAIGLFAFYGCSGLTSVAIPYSVTSIGSYAFNCCSGLTSVTIPNSVTSIGASAFEYCSGLTSVTIPNSVTSIGNYAFRGCSGLESMVVAAGNSTYDSRDNCNAIIETATNTLISGCKTTTIPNSVTGIYMCAFQDCSGLTSVTIPNSVTSIGYSAFYCCSGLTSVTIPNSVTTIGERAFVGCSGLTSVTIPNSVISIGQEAFRDCSGLTSVTIPNSVTSIGASAFEYCSGLTSVTIPNSVTSIGNWAFESCSGLTSVTLPASVTSIGASAFEDCSGLTDIVSYIENPSSVAMGSSVFSSVPTSTCILHVPYGASDAYRNASQWSAFTNIVEMEPPTVLVTSVALNETAAEVTAGETLQLTATVLPDDATDKSVTWTSNNEAVATVDATGLVTAVAAGTATITATTNDGSALTAICEITVNPAAILATSVSLDQSNVSLSEGMTLQLTATVQPEDATDKSVAWGSSNEAVATVDENGLVTAVAAGTATITATTSDGSNLAASCEITVEATAANRLDVQNYTVLRGNTLILPVQLVNTANNLTALQADIHLPEGIGIEMGGDEYVIDLVSDRVARDHTLSSNRLASGAVRVLIASPTKKLFTGNSGDLFTISLLTSDEMSAGDYAVTIDNIILSDNEATTYHADDVTSTITVKDVEMGDVNGDGNVTVSDVVLTAQKAVGMSPEPFNEANADVNGDGNINVTDVVIIANIAVGAQAAPRRAPMLHDADMNRLTASELNIHAGESQTITLALDNATEFTAFQMQMTLPEGLTIEQARLSDRAGSHSLLVNNADGTTRLLGFSAGNDVIEGNDGVLLEVTLKAEGNFDAYSAVKLSDMVFVEPNGTAHQLDDLMLVNGIATGVEQVNTTARIYGHEGHIVIEAAVSGLAQIVMANGMSRTVKVAAGRNVVPMPAGMYIVKMNNAVAKIKL